jgi:AcrR family transcriptional regulator
MSSERPVGVEQSISADRRAQDPGSRLLTVAAALFRQKGYAAATTRELAGLLGIQNASLYHHIRSKEDLLYQLCVDSLTRMRMTAEEVLAQEFEPLDRLRALARAHVVTSLGDQDSHATMLIELRGLSAARRAEVIELRATYEAIVESVIAEAQSAALLRSDISAKHLRLAFLNLLNWTIFWFRQDGELTSEQLGDLFADIFISGVAAASERRS